ncbi:MAG: acyl-CoA dehydrogenase [Pseudomonadota bacterium]
MSLDTFPIDKQDIAFVLFDQLGVEQLLELEQFKSVSLDEVRMVLDEAERFAKNEVWPTSAVADREGCTFDKGKVKVPACFHDLFRMYAENGWIALTAPEQMGGSGMPSTIGIAVGEMLAGANIAFSIYPGLTRGAAGLIEAFGTDWMKETFAQRLYSGEWLGTMCLTEPQAGTAVGDLRTMATRKGDHYSITGNKSFISSGENELTSNIIHLVLAKTPDGPKGIKGLSLFIVPKIRVEEDGSLGEPNDVVCVGIEEKMGIHGSCTCTLNFGDSEKCRGILIGSEGDGIRIMFHLMNEARIGCGMQGMTAGSAAYQFALDYSKERIQGVEIQNMRDFDAPRVPIIMHPDVKRMLFTMKAQVEGMRALLYRAAFYADISEFHPDGKKREHCHKLLELLTPICKAYCTDKGFDVAIMALQTYGGAGYISENPIEQFARDAKISSIYEGANGIQALDLVGRKLSKNAGEYFMLFMDEIQGLIKANRDHPVVGGLAERLDKEVGRVQSVTMKFGAEGMAGNIRFPVMNATQYLAMLGNLTLGWLLLEQAVIANDRLSGLMLEKNVDSMEAKKKLLADNPTAAFYHGKTETASFFIRNLLPQNAGIEASIMEGAPDFLDVEI